MREISSVKDYYFIPFCQLQRISGDEVVVSREIRRVCCVIVHFEPLSLDLLAETKKYE
jgi:hypothetical protein